MEREKRKRIRPSSTSSSKVSGAPDKVRPVSSQRIMKTSPSGGSVGVGPIGPSMKMKDNPAMAMVLAQSLPAGSQQSEFLYLLMFLSIPNISYKAIVT